MLRLGARSGYDVKRAVDVSARFFWTISQAQIYPALKRLEKEGLVRGRSDPRGQRRRRVYEVTPAGERALREWLRGGEELSMEIRDLATLKLFFADVLDDDEVRAHLHAMRARSEQLLDRMERDS